MSAMVFCFFEMPHRISVAKGYLACAQRRRGTESETHGLLHMRLWREAEIEGQYQSNPTHHFAVVNVEASLEFVRICLHTTAGKFAVSAFDEHSVTSGGGEA